MKRLIAGIVFFAFTTVASTVLASARINDVIHDQLAIIEKQGFTLPPLSIVTVPPLFNGKAIIVERPVRYVVVITEYAFWSEKSVRTVVSHEAGHVLFDVHGVENSEDNARLFASCIVGDTSGVECDELYDKLRQ